VIEWASALLIVLGAIALLRVALQAARVGGGGRRRSLRVVESCALGTRQRIHVVEVAGERLLVGSSEAGLTLLRQLPAAEAAPEDPEAAPASEPRPRPPRLGAPLRAWLRAGGLGGVAVLLATFLEPGAALAQEAISPATLSLALDGATAPEGIASTLEILGLLTLVSVAPSILLMATCFTRLVIVFAFLRQAIGIQQLPPSQVLVGLAFFTTLFVMAPVGDQIRVDAYEPYVAREIDARVASERAVAPVRGFMLHHTRESDLELFLEISGREEVAELADVPFTTLLPAYMISELRTAFEIGFMIYLPFLVVDLVIASMLISMGMIVLPPIVISLPFKLMLFVLLDGWNLVVASLVTGLR